MTISLFKPPKSAIIGAIRRLFAMSVMYKHIKSKSLVDEVGPRGGKMVRCECCGKSVPWSKAQLDHNDPVIPIDKTADEMSYDEIVSRIWCSQENLSALCEECHNAKTKKENLERREFKKRLKKVMDK